MTQEGWHKFFIQYDDGHVVFMDLPYKNLPTTIFKGVRAIIDVDVLDPRLREQLMRMVYV